MGARGAVRAARRRAQWDPIFISDALVGDVAAHVDWLAERGGGAVAARLRAASAGGLLRMREDAYYNAPLGFDAMPPELSSELAGCSLAVVKGDGGSMCARFAQNEWVHSFVSA